MRIRFNIPIVRTVRKARAFVRHPARFIARRIFRFGFSLGILGISIGLGGVFLGIHLPFISAFFKLFGSRKRGSGGGSGGGSREKRGSRRSGADRDNDGSQGSGEPRDGGSPRGDGPSGSPRGGDPMASARESMVRTRESLRERLRRLRDEEEREIRENDPGLRREREEAERERAEREQKARETAERERAEREKAEREKAEREQKERETADRERAEREQKARETAEREKTEREQKERDKAEREAQAERERQETERHQKAQQAQRGRSARSERQVRSFAAARARAATRPPSGSAFELSAPLPIGARVLLEASAGTGKTYSLTSLVARYVAELGLEVDELLMVTFTKAAAAEMRERTRDKLAVALAALESGRSIDQIGDDREWLGPILECDEEERSERVQRLRAAVTEIDSATITTIHGFFQQMLREIGLKSADVATAEVGTRDSNVTRRVVRDSLVSMYASGTDELAAGMPGKTPDAVETRVLEVLRALDSNMSAKAAPDGECDPAATAWARFVSGLKRAIANERIGSGILSFDDLVGRMADIVHPENPLSAGVVSVVRERYRLVLIDEFQDTDDMQWSIFSSLFDVEAVDRDPARPFLAIRSRPSTGSAVPTSPPTSGRSPTIGSSGTG
mgnify:CR=1 FL=1